MEESLIEYDVDVTGLPPPKNDLDAGQIPPVRMMLMGPALPGQPGEVNLSLLLMVQPGIS